MHKKQWITFEILDLRLLSIKLSRAIGNDLLMVTSINDYVNMMFQTDFDHAFALNESIEAMMPI